MPDRQGSATATTAKGPDRSEPRRSGPVTIHTATDLGAIIRERRKQLGHTQAEAASLCRVGIRFLSELERGKPTAEIGRALKVAQRLGLRVQVLPRDAASEAGRNQPSDGVPPS